MSAINALLEFVEGRGKIPSQVAYLRQVEKKIEECFVQCSPCDMRTELFSVYLLLSHVFNMLTGDIRYHKDSNEISNSIFNAIVDLVDKLVLILKVGNDVKEEFESCYSNTVMVYLNGLKQINDLIKNEK